MTQPRRLRPLAGLVAAVLLVGLPAACADDSGGTDGAGSPTPVTPQAPTPTTLPATTPRTSPTPTPQPSKAPPQVGGATTPAAGSLYAPGDIDPGLQPWVDDATADLAERLGVETGDVSTIAAVLVTWPDSSLGCPQPGMEYLQVLTDGAVIELDAGGAVYRYHAGDGSGPFLCGTPITSAPAPAG